MKDWFRERFHGLYWRQMAVTVGMVFLTLVLLGVSFFSLSYSYARGQKTDELMVRAMAVSKLSVRYLETGRYLSMEELQKDEQFRQLAATAAEIISTTKPVIISSPAKARHRLLWMAMSSCPRMLLWRAGLSPFRHQ